MFGDLIKKIFGTSSDRQIKHILPIVEEINEIYETLHELTDDQLKGKTAEFKNEIFESTRDIRKELNEVKELLKGELDPLERERIADREEDLEKELYEREQEILEEILPEVFAVVKETCRRMCGKTWKITGHEITWNMVPYDVQLIGGIVLHQGKISEMATGEGKTLVATMPLYLNALTGRGCHLVTVNDYLAQRDSEWMGEIYKFLGLTVGCLQNEMDSEQRREQYAKDILYGTNNEFGFDYLRDNMAVRPEDVVQRKHFYAIVDEVDSLLIDEARTPLIISGPTASSTTAETYKKYKPDVERLVHKQVVLSNRKMTEAEKLLDEGKEYEAGILLLQVQKSTPKNTRFMKLLKQPGIKKLIDRVELDYMRDKNIQEIEEELYFAQDEHANTINLTDMGRNELAPNHSEIFIIPDLATEYSVIEDNEELNMDEKIAEKEKLTALHNDRSEINHSISQLLKAYTFFANDVEYVKKDGQIMIVDEFTGRLMPGRRYSDGLHQAIEAKEGVTVQRQTQTLATITIQNYFRMYKKLGGMTGTAETEATEFWDIYKLDTVVIPTNEPIRRLNYNDLIYRSKREKYSNLLEEISEMHERKRPVLVGTVSVEVSETISRMLKRAGIPHSVLNAKYHKQEAEIVTRAGLPGTVTIATNMAGRGTDIKLGDGVVNKECAQIRDKLRGEYESSSEIPWCCVACSLEKECRNAPEPLCGKSKKMFECKEEIPCGLHIVGTERHEARRIDRQLRGRSARQGDPGSSKFYLSLEDDLMRLFASDRIATIMDKFGIQDGEVIQHPMVTSAIGRAQKRVEAQNFSIRKHLLEYDDVMNQQREIVYSLRQRILSGSNLKDEFRKIIGEFIDKIIEEYTSTQLSPEEWDWENIGEDMRKTFLMDPRFSEKNKEGINFRSLEDELNNIAEKAYHLREQSLGSELMRGLERYVLLGTIDEKWKEHLYFMDDLKEGISLMSYAQKDPLVEYKRSAYEAFVELLDNINQQALERLFKTRVLSRREERPTQGVQTSHQSVSAYERGASGEAQPAGVVQGGRPSPPPGRKQQPLRVKKVGRNDPCPCGSGKKYKKCCGANT
ncbi:preprotein translocase subunit SecA [bacterium]|nr:preprotein translocase subunit SecA [bacterium]